VAGTEPGPHSLSKASTTSAASIKPTKKTASQPPRALTSCTTESRLRGAQTTPSARRQHSSHVTVMGLQTMRHPCLPACMTACLLKTIMPAPPVILLLLVGGRCCILPEEQTGLFQAPAADMCPLVGRSSASMLVVDSFLVDSRLGKMAGRGLRTLGWAQTRPASPCRAAAAAMAAV
jgi:hypothetical protein